MFDYISVWKNIQTYYTIRFLCSYDSIMKHTILRLPTLMEAINEKNHN